MKYLGSFGKNRDKSPDTKFLKCQYQKTNEYLINNYCLQSLISEVVTGKIDVRGK